MIDPSKKNTHLLTVLVEDYFHVGAFGDLIQRRNWPNFEPRYEQNTLKTLDLLDQYDTKATFFILGWIAEQNPQLVKEIAARGHEIGSRGYYHRSLDQLTAEEIKEDIRKTNSVLRDASGQNVIGYRSAEKLSYEKDDHILDILAQEGFTYDASFLPGKKSDIQKRFPHKLQREDNTIWEFPYSTSNLGLGLLPISGGNYFRQIPYTLMRHAVKNWTEAFDQPFLFYFHVWELDPDQPRISAASRYNRIRHYRKLDKMEWIIKENLEKYEFSDIADFIDCRELLKVKSLTPEPKPEAVKVNERAVKKQKIGQVPISIVIPCYNEVDSLDYLANILQSVAEKLNRKGFNPRYIFVDDASTDQTLQKIKSLFSETENVKILHHDENKGVAAGIMTGIRAADTEIVCSMDCDCTYDPHQLVDLLPLLTTGIDMVTASQYHRQGGVRNVPKWRLVFSKGASFCYRRVLRTKLATYTSCFRVYRRSSMLDVNIEDGGFLGVTEMLGKLDLQGGKIVEAPAVLETRLFGASKMNTLRTTFRHIGLLYRLSKDRILRKSEESEVFGHDRTASKSTGAKSKPTM